MIVGAYRCDKHIRHGNRSDTKEDALGEAVDVMVLILIVIYDSEYSNNDSV